METKQSLGNNRQAIEREERETSHIVKGNNDGSIDLLITHKAHLSKETVDSLLKIAKDLKYEGEEAWGEFKDTFIADAFSIDASLRPVLRSDADLDVVYASVGNSQWFESIKDRLDGLLSIHILRWSSDPESLRFRSPGFYTYDYIIELEPQGKKLVEELKRLEETKKLSRTE
jgi:hypothetical protein